MRTLKSLFRGNCTLRVDVPPCSGLRWWSVVTEAGELVWRYESWSPEQRAVAQQAEASLFWLVTLAQQAAWTLLALVAVFR